MAQSRGTNKPSRYISSMQALRILGYKSQGVVKGMVKRGELKNYAPKAAAGQRQKYLLKRVKVEELAGQLGRQPAARNNQPVVREVETVAAAVDAIIADIEQQFTTLRDIEQQFTTLRRALKVVWG